MSRIKRGTTTHATASAVRQSSRRARWRRGSAWAWRRLSAGCRRSARSEGRCADGVGEAASRRTSAADPPRPTGAARCPPTSSIWRRRNRPRGAALFSLPLRAAVLVCRHRYYHGYRIWCSLRPRNGSRTEWGYGTLPARRRIPSEVALVSRTAPVSLDDQIQAEDQAQDQTERQQP